MTLRLAPDGSEVRVSMPRWGRTAEALAFVQARGDWLARQLAALPRPAATARPWQAVCPIAAKLLRIEHAPGAPRRPLAQDGSILVGGPEVTVEAASAPLAGKRSAAADRRGSGPLLRPRWA